MSTDLVTTSPNVSVLDATRRMDEAQLRHLPVLDKGRIAGKVSMRDLFTVLVDDMRDASGIAPIGTEVMVVEE